MQSPHDDHPGHSARDCEHRLTIVANPRGTSSNGYACSQTGGHCQPYPGKCPVLSKGQVQMASR